MSSKKDINKYIWVVKPNQQPKDDYLDDLTTADMFGKIVKTQKSQVAPMKIATNDATCCWRIPVTGGSASAMNELVERMKNDGYEVYINLINPLVKTLDQGDTSRYMMQIYATFYFNIHDFSGTHDPIVTEDILQNLTNSISSNGKVSGYNGIINLLAREAEYPFSSFFYSLQAFMNRRLIDVNVIILTDPPTAIYPYDWIKVVFDSFNIQFGSTFL
jgi:hypothetical protein